METPRKRTGTDLLIACALALVCAALQVLAARYWDPKTSQSTFVFSDEGAILYCARQILHGAVPYRDFFFHYGPVPLYSLVPFVAWLGPVPLAIQVHKTFFDLFPLALLAWIYLAYVPRRWVIAGLFLSSFCYLANPAFLHGSFEKFGMLAIAAFWVPPRRRGIPRALTLGVLLSALQLVKFGGCFIMGASLLLIDALCMWRERADAGALRGWFGNLCAILLGYLTGQLGLFALSFMLLPAGYSLDAVLPLFHLDWYRSYVGAEHRWPDFVNWNYFLTYQFPILLGLAGAVGIFLAALRAKRSGTSASKLDSAALRFLLLPFVYAIGAPIYFGHAANVMVYGWLAVTVLPFLLYVAPTFLRWGLVLVLLPCAAVLPKHIVDGIRKPIPSDLAWHRMPNGYSVLLTQQEGAHFDKVATKLQELDRTTPGKGFVILPLGFTYHLWADIPSASRHHWYFPGVVRRYEMDKVAAQFTGAKAIVEVPEFPPVPWQVPADLEKASMLPLKEPLKSEVLRHFESPEWLGTEMVFFRSRGVSASGGPISVTP